MMIKRLLGRVLPFPGPGRRAAADLSQESPVGSGELIHLNHRNDQVLPKILITAWIPVAYDNKKRPIRFYNSEHRATIGYVPGRPEWAYLDHESFTYAYAMSLRELVEGLANGKLPEPVAVVD